MINQPTLSVLPVDQLAVRQIIADIDKATIGRRRIDIAHAILRIVAMEIAMNATSSGAMKRNTELVCTDFKGFTREEFKARRARTLRGMK